MHEAPDHATAPADLRTRLAMLLRRLTWRHLVVAAGAVAVGFGMEGLITGAIAFFAHRLGFWWGMAAFTGTWLAGGLLVLALTDRLWPQHTRANSDELLKNGLIGRWIARLATRARVPAALAVAWFFGPLEGPPAFRALGYHGRELALWEIVSAPIFCVFWFGWTIGGFNLVRDLIDRVV